MNSYLDIKKSVLISSPAGSGKTEKLARRYISLLKSGAEVEKVLAITFTEKAAAEMKDRILRILGEEEPELFLKIKGKIPLMRISTIHAFCLRLLRRFSAELALDPALDVMDELEARILWLESIYETLRAEGGGAGVKTGRKPGVKRVFDPPFFSALKEGGLKGWNSVFRLLDEFHFNRRVMGNIEQASVGGGPRFELYKKCLRTYRRRKAEGRRLDFDDLEILAHEALSKSPDWQNILYCFDEHTDHMLVDEFQDTSTLQWRIIEKLTEEWRSGLGAKKDSGRTPTLFLVGDEKQSIYLFRGANVSLFHEAREKLPRWLGGEYSFIEVKENYRSLPAIVDFINQLFGKIMAPPGASGLKDSAAPEGEKTETPKVKGSMTPPQKSIAAEEERTETSGGKGAVPPPWKTSYSPFRAVREGKGAVELILVNQGENDRTADIRKKEAALLAKRIKALCSPCGRSAIKAGGSAMENRSDKGFAIDNKGFTPGDIAILLRKRTHLAVFEDALRGEGIPYIVLKGIGFYDEPEVALLRELISVMVDPGDDYSLFCLLRSPLFSIDYGTLLSLGKEDPTLLESLKRLAKEPGQTKAMRALKRASALLEKWLKDRAAPLSRLIERALIDSDGWRHFREAQCRANIKKFISLIESFEASGLSPVEIREKLLRQRHSDVPKANINAEGMDAVKIMTIHAAKGLEFPAVFIPSLDEDVTPRSGPLAIDEYENGGIAITTEENSRKRAKDEIFIRRKEKELEEEKRLFYVAVTRARDYLCLLGGGLPSPSPEGDRRPLLSGGRGPLLSGARGPSPCLLSYLDDAFGFLDEGGGLREQSSFRFVTEEEIERQCRLAAAGPMGEEPFIDEPIYTEPLACRPEIRRLGVTEDAEPGVRHGEHWLLIGRIMHGIFEELSKGIIGEGELEGRVRRALRAEAADVETLAATILDDVRKLMADGRFRAIILPSGGSFAELPFVMEKGGKLFSGRIDRLLVRDGTVFVYDYKTFPVGAGGVPELVEKYRFQMELYRQAAGELFSLRARAFIVFTHTPEIVEIKAETFSR